MSDKTFTILRISLFSLLVVLGAYTFIYYLGVPVHQSVLLSESGRQAVASACPGITAENQRIFCQGLHAFFPFFGQFFAWISPMTWFIGWSIVAFCAFLGACYLKTNSLIIRFRMTPLYLYLSFIAALWLIFTVISTGSNGNMPYSRLIEPSPQVYGGADAEGIQVLQDNFQRLQSGGCLRELTGQSFNGAKVYDIKQRCFQTSFVTIVLPQVLLVSFLLFVCIVLGRFLLLLIPGFRPGPLLEAVFSVGVGACGLIALLWLIALIGGYINQPIYSQAAGWGLLLLIPAALYKQTIYWAKSFIKREWEYEGIAWSITLILAWLVIGYLALNFLNVVRPFPIGWDDLGKYINQPRLLVSYGYFIPQLASFQWEYITSLGFLLFGYESVFGATAAMEFNWMAGLLGVISVYAFGRTFLGRGGGLLVALIYYTLPLVGHFSYADMKVDNAVFTMSSLAIFALFLALFPTFEEEAEQESEGIKTRINWQWLVLAGALAGFAFSMKPTSIMTVMAMGAILFGVGVHWTAFLGAVSVAWGLFAYEGRFSLTEILTRVYGHSIVANPMLVFGAFIVTGMALLTAGIWLRKQNVKKTAIATGIFVASFVVSIAPWIITNNIAYGNVIPGLIFTAPNRISPEFVIGKTAGRPVEYGQDIRTLPPELLVDETRCRGTAKSEELDRYWGYGAGWKHYLTLPWRTVMNLDSAGYYVTTIPALLLFPLLLLLPFFWMKQGKWLRWLTWGTLFMLWQWMFLSNGIPWYGLGTFFGLALGLEALIKRSPDVPVKIVASIVLLLSLMTAYSQRFWQFDQQRNIFEYSLGKVSYESMRERTIPHYDDIREIMDQRKKADPAHPYTYRVGTFIPYFIPKNLEALPMGDHQLDFFNCLYIERDPQLTFKRLRALGFNGIIFDTNTNTIERDVNGSLHQKVNLFVEFVNKLGLPLPINDVDGGIAYVLLDEPAPPAAVEEKK